MYQDQKTKVNINRPVSLNPKFLAGDFNVADSTPWPYTSIDEKEFDS